MTTQELTALALPHARLALMRARPMIASELGMVRWILFRPLWGSLTERLLPLLTRIAIELAVGLAAPRLLSLLVVLHRVASLISEKYLPDADKACLAEITELLSTDRGRMLEPVRETLKVSLAALKAVEEDKSRIVSKCQ